EQIICSSGSRRMSDLSQHTGYSSRYIAKVFHEYVGMSPKLFSRIVRFQHVLDALLRSNYEGVMEEMMELGYYDQNHFIKEFKEFSSFTPKKYMEQL
ncbi:helix-turn-helix domain-containing protein, partial [Enterobacter quasiroggenkampii]|nr:helix-turn-helix domain-containing protein [Enterobacter quasiroggenkampii]